MRSGADTNLRAIDNPIGATVLSRCPLFTRDLHLPRGLERELVRDREHEYTPRGSEVRTRDTTLATVDTVSSAHSQA
jgi:hypothetical protein